jgi:hypothetical protein
MALANCPAASIAGVSRGSRRSRRALPAKFFCAQNAAIAVASPTIFANHLKY